MTNATDQAAALFARRGVAKTSVQEVADAVGLSKTGLLHHFPSKDALHAAVVAQATSLGQRVLDRVRDLPAGVDRDRSALEVLVDVALAHPGMVAMLLTPVMHGVADVVDPTDGGIGGAAFQAFGVDPLAPVSERSVRVAGAMVSRMHEAHSHGAAPLDAIRTGFRQAAPVVVAAALIMFSVFAGFVPAGDATLKSIAFALAAGILFDAFVVRMVLVPAALALLGERAWWLPRRLNWLPSLDVEGSALTEKAPVVEKRKQEVTVGER